MTACDPAHWWWQPRWPPWSWQGPQPTQPGGTRGGTWLAPMPNAWKCLDDLKPSLNMRSWKKGGGTKHNMPHARSFCCCCCCCCPRANDATSPCFLAVPMNRSLDGFHMSQQGCTNAGIPLPQLLHESLNHYSSKVMCLFVRRLHLHATWNQEMPRKNSD